LGLLPILAGLAVIVLPEAGQSTQASATPASAEGSLNSDPAQALVDVPSLAGAIADPAFDSARLEEPPEQYMPPVPSSPVPEEVRMPESAPENVRRFIQKFLALAQEQHDRYGVPVGIQLAVAGLEGGCNAGNHWPLDPVGNNWFNIIDASNDPYGNGSYRCGGQNYRTYPSAESAWQAFGYVLTHDPNYREFQSDLDDPEGFVERFYPIYCACQNTELLKRIYKEWMAMYDE
jgi:flagellum-specific peptidoglycan hydrolase FlgJ